MQIYTWVSSILLLPGTACWEYSSTTPKYFFQLVEISFEIAFFWLCFWHEKEFWKDRHLKQIAKAIMQHNQN